MFQVTAEQDGVTWSKSTARGRDARLTTAFDAVPIRPNEAPEANADYYVRVRLTRIRTCGFRGSSAALTATAGPISRSSDSVLP